VTGLGKRKRTDPPTKRRGGVKPDHMTKGGTFGGEGKEEGGKKGGRGCLLGCARYFFSGGEGVPTAYGRGTLYMDLFRGGGGSRRLPGREGKIFRKGGAYCFLPFLRKGGKKATGRLICRTGRRKTLSTPEESENLQKESAADVKGEGTRVRFLLGQEKGSAHSAMTWKGKRNHKERTRETGPCRACR